jgi:para-aminobenzoate synthetase
MRTLIVDNYDSFTYNLFHLVAGVNGCEPLVIANDTPIADVDLTAFDNVVISAGPGRPDRPADFGISAEILRHADLPVLGICLGHQGLCQLAGAQVGLAPEPMHGRESLIAHDGTGLFAGIPSPFSVVRYHSLAVYELPDVLEVTAQTADGTVMAVAHRLRPRWGVQFHPESIATEHGPDLARNFRTLTERWWRRRTGRGSYRMHCRRVDVLPAPELIHLELFAASATSFWLDSSSSEDPRSRFSFLGDAAGPLSEVVTYDVTSGALSVTRGNSTAIDHRSIFGYLEGRIGELSLEPPAGLPTAFNLGYVGYFGYELKAETGGSSRHKADTPDAAFILADRMIVHDRIDGGGWLLALSCDDGPAGARAEDADAWIDATSQRLACCSAVDHVDRGGSALAFLRHEPARYIELIEQAQEWIRQGETYELCLTNMAAGVVTAAPEDVYRRMRTISPVPFGAHLQLGQLSILSASPERFLSVSPDRVVESRPIKGTRPRGRTPEEDAAIAQELARSDKDRAENLMIVDLVRHDLGRVCVPGSVHVPARFCVETFPNVHQLVSTVRGTLTHGCSAIDAVRAAFPGGSMTGAPKIRTMELIDRLEAGPRGVYSGALGWLSLSGACDLSIVIRTVVLNGASASFGIGGAILALSDPAEEYAETMVKAQVMAAALNAGEISGALTTSDAVRS